MCVFPAFPYPVGTVIARDFGNAGIFRGQVHTLYPDDTNLCQVRFTDGDREDMDRDQVHYAVQLYVREFGGEE